MFIQELYQKQLLTQNCDVNVNHVEQNGINEPMDKDNGKNDGKMRQSIILSWSEMRKLQDNTNTWCFLNFFLSICCWMVYVDRVYLKESKVKIIDNTI